MFAPFRSRRVRGILSKNRPANWWPTLLIVAVPLIFPLAAYAQVGGSPFDTGFTAMQTLFTGTVAKVASLIAIVIGGYQLCARRAGRKEGSRRRRRGNRDRCSRCERPELALGRLSESHPPLPTFHHSERNEGLMADRKPQPRRTNRVFKSLHKPLTYLGVERTLFFWSVSALSALSTCSTVILAGVVVFIGGFAFGRWVTNSDPAFLRILAKSSATSSATTPPSSSIPRVEVR